MKVRCVQRPPLPGLHFQGSERVGGVPRVGLVPIAVRGDLARAEGAPKTCLGAFRLVLEGARQRRRAFQLDTWTSQNPPHHVPCRLWQSTTRRHTRPNENASRKTDQDSNAGSELGPVPGFPVPSSSNVATPASSTKSSG